MLCVLCKQPSLFCLAQFAAAMPPPSGDSGVLWRVRTREVAQAIEERRITVAGLVCLVPEVDSGRLCRIDSDFLQCYPWIQILIFLSWPEKQTVRIAIRDQDEEV